MPGFHLLSANEKCFRDYKIDQLTTIHDKQIPIDQKILYEKDAISIYLINSIYTDTYDFFVTLEKIFWNILETISIESSIKGVH
jgi:hypothetical protein